MLYDSIDIKLFLTSSNNETFASHVQLCPLLLVKFSTVTCSELRQIHFLAKNAFFQTCYSFSHCTSICIAFFLKHVGPHVQLRSFLHFTKFL